MGVYAGLCERHTFEAELIPEAIANGWPTSIEWSAVKARVVAMRGPLESILHDPGRRIVYGQPKAQESLWEMSAEGPRMECVFWQELLKELEASGSRHVSGIAGQFATFEKAQTG
jgi:hypothetical protein